MLGIMVAGCSASEPHQLPSATMTPHLESRASAVACGDDVSLYGATTPDIRYAYSYNDAGQLTHATGTFAAGGTDDSVDYGYDAAGNFAHMLESNGAGGSRAEITASYDGASNLLDYTWDYAASDYHDSWDYAFTGFSGVGPARETLTEQGQPSYGYALLYDASGRLAQATGDAGDVTTWTYDDAALTITIDTNGGAWHGVISYDADDNELSEVWGGTDPSAIASSDVFAWSGDQLLSATYSSGSTDAPQTLATIEVDTLRYDCSAARTAQGRTMKLVRPRVSRAR